MRNRRTARGAYEVPLDPGAGAGGHHRGDAGAGPGAGGMGYGGGGYAHDEIWDSRVGEGGYGGAGRTYYEEQELGMSRPGAGSGPYDMGGRAEAGVSASAGARVVPTTSTITVDLHAGEPEQEVERGRSRSREPSFGRQGGENPFADDAESSQLRDVNSRPEVGGERTAAGNGATAPVKRVRSTDRRSAFRESL